MFEFLIDVIKGIGNGYLNFIFVLLVVCVIFGGIFALYTKIWEWFEEKDPAYSWLAYPLILIIVITLAWISDNLL